MSMTVSKRPRSSRIWLLPLCASALALPLAAQAMTKPKPGLWQQYTKSEVNGKDIVAAMAAARQQMMSKLTPEQRKMMEERMGPAEDDPHIIKSCLTAAQVDRINSPQDFVDQLNKDNDSCKYDATPVGSDTIKFHGSCAGEGEFNGDMNGTLIMKSTTAYSMSFAGKGKVTAAGDNAKPLDIKGTIDAKWLGSDCGDISPDE
ncbi:DUF3617 domain-containing protein [Solimonas marina]|uniref:DUF3617 domain-containing protein n=1 Tax=Solimonas marina TaxID=2714601 RepID=A0A969WCQ4_9GAMM|nr:DUF3617 domain-containing protein [Solimonas marina]NKF24133.1 DUF3617 domain-containing protein [Solimonas marina]